jgi:hypothetical protein
MDWNSNRPPGLIIDEYEYDDDDDDDDDDVVDLADDMTPIVPLPAPYQNT